MHDPNANQTARADVEAAILALRSQGRAPPHDVPAVDAFRKALTEAEKQAAARKAQHP